MKIVENLVKKIYFILKKKWVKDHVFLDFLATLPMDFSQNLIG
jgi:hypothetical protein